MYGSYLHAMDIVNVAPAESPPIATRAGSTRNSLACSAEVTLSITE